MQAPQVPLPVLLERRVLGARRLHRRPVHRRVFPVQEDGAVPAPPGHRRLRGAPFSLRGEVGSSLLDIRYHIQLDSLFTLVRIKTQNEDMLSVDVFLRMARRLYVTLSHSHNLINSLCHIW